MILGRLHHRDEDPRKPLEWDVLRYYVKQNAMTDIRSRAHYTNQDITYQREQWQPPKANEKRGKRLLTFMGELALSPNHPLQAELFNDGGESSPSHAPQQKREAQQF